MTPKSNVALRPQHSELEAVPLVLLLVDHGENGQHIRKERLRSPESQHRSQHKSPARDRNNNSEVAKHGDVALTYLHRLSLLIIEEVF